MSWLRSVWRKMTMASHYRCIYCMNSLPRDEFNAEHVMPRQLGTFKHNLTLNNVVCKRCNQFFGNHLEPLLAYGSTEAVSRLDFGIRPPAAADRLRRNRIQFAAELDGPWDGVLLELKEESGQLVVGLVNQIGFKSEGAEKYDFFTEDQVRDSGQPLPDALDPDTGIFIIGDSDESRSGLQELLADRGVEFKPQGERDNPLSSGESVLAAITTKVDDIILRTIAKISFNYLARCQGSEFVLDPEFDPIRGLIRFGERIGHRTVEYDSGGRQFDGRNGHLLTLSWEGRDLYGHVLLFNQTRYRIRLVKDYRGIWRPIRKGHFFDLDARAVSQLESSTGS